MFMEFILPVVMPQMIDFIAFKLNITNEIMRFLLAGLVSVVVGAGIVFTNTDLTRLELPAIIAVVYGVSQAIFKIYWKSSAHRLKLFAFLQANHITVQETLSKVGLEEKASPPTTARAESSTSTVIDQVLLTPTKDIGVPR